MAVDGERSALMCLGSEPSMVSTRRASMVSPISVPCSTCAWSLAISHSWVLQAPPARLPATRSIPPSRLTSWVLNSTNASFGWTSMWKNPRFRAADLVRDLVRRRAVGFARGLAFAVFARTRALVFDGAAVLVRAAVRRGALLLRRAFCVLRMFLRAADFWRAVAILLSSFDCTADVELLSRGA